MSAPPAVVVGPAGKWPLAGVMVHNLHYLVGLGSSATRCTTSSAGNGPRAYHNPRLDEVTAHVAGGLEALGSVLPAVGIGPGRVSLVDGERGCHRSRLGSARRRPRPRALEHYDVPSTCCMRMNPLEVTGTLDAYRGLIADSYADLEIAKHAYVSSSSGWFSDRSTSYLGSGRPVLHQETGSSDWPLTGEGVFTFSTADDVAAALEQIDDHEHRALAEEHLEA
jgi:hypothetical protein